MEKITVAEISDDQFHRGFMPWASNVWLLKTDGIWTGFIDSSFQPEEQNPDEIILKQVIAVNVKNINYTRVSTLADVINNDASFLYDIDNNALYIHFNDDHTPWFYGAADIAIGYVIGLYQSSVSLDPYQFSQIMNDDIYESRLQAYPNAQSKIDNDFYAKPQYPSGSIVFDNADMKYINFLVGRDPDSLLPIRKKNGNYVRVMRWEGDSIINDMTYSDLTDNVIFQGLIETGSEDYQNNTIVLNARDIRKAQYTTESPTRILDNSLWPDLKNDNQKILPQVWGQCYRVPCLCLDEKQSSPTNFTFMVADNSLHDIKAIDAAYIDDETVSSTPTIDNTTYKLSQGLATFTIPASTFQYDSTSGDRYTGMNKVTIDVKGYVDDSNDLIINTLAIVRQIFKDDYDLDFTSTIYDTTAWNAVEIVAPDAGYYVNEPKSTPDKIADLQKNLPGSKWDVTTDRLLTWTDYNYVDYANSVVFKAGPDILPQSFSPVLATNSSEVVAIVRTGIQKKWKTGEDEYSYIDNTDNQENAFLNFKSSTIKPFDTLLSNSSDLAVFEAKIIALSGFSKDTFSISINSASESLGRKASTLKAGEYIEVLCNLDNTLLLGFVVCRINDQSNTADGQTNLDLQIEYSEQLNFKQLHQISDGKGNVIGVGGVPLLIRH
jgi:hypothetical protein